MRNITQFLILCHVPTFDVYVCNILLFLLRCLCPESSVSVLYSSLILVFISSISYFFLFFLKIPCVLCSLHWLPSFSSLVITSMCLTCVLFSAHTSLRLSLPSSCINVKVSALDWHILMRTGLFIFCLVWWFLDSTCFSYWMLPCLFFWNRLLPLNWFPG